jgi:hypothetical protein
MIMKTGSLKMSRIKVCCMPNAAFGILFAVSMVPVLTQQVQAQQVQVATSSVTDAAMSKSLPDAPLPSHQTSSSDEVSQDTNGQAGAANGGASSEGYVQGKQTKRILGIVPNFRSVSADQKLPPQTAKDKFKTTMEDNFDYSSFIFVAGLAGVALAEDSYPEFHQGAAGYGRYYWHTLADQTDENTFVEFVLPVALRQDARYYTLGHGGVIKRTIYSFGRVLITRDDSGREDANYSEIVGAGAAAGISDLYYPSIQRTWTKTGQRWLTNVILDGATFTVKEFWPDINDHVFHQKD